MPDRPKALFYLGERNAAGQPMATLPGVPARDLTEADLQRLSDEQIAEAVASPLYQKTKPAGRGGDAPPAEKPLKPPRVRNRTRSPKPEPALAETELEAEDANPTADVVDAAVVETD